MFDEFENMPVFAMIPDEMFGEDDEEEFLEEELSEEELLAEEQEFMVSMQQGNWLDGYLDAMDEM